MLIRLLTIGLAAGLALGLAVPSLAEAATVDSVASASTTTSDEVTGQPWSAPAYPVDCRETDEQITCTPTDPSAVKSQQCFSYVAYAGHQATLCTTFDGHVSAIQNAGGRPLLVQYGCSVGDVVCVTFENAGRGMALAATGMMYVVAANTRFDTSTVLWSAATEEWSFWQWAVLVVLFAAFVWAIAAAVVSGDREQLVGAIVRCFIAVPAVPITLWLTGKLLSSIDQMTWYVMNRGSADGLFTTLQGVMWAGGQANYFFAFVIHGMLMLAMILLMLVFAFRNIVLAALIAVGPIAWMIFPLRGIGPQWVVRYFSSVVVLLLTGPLTIGFVSLIIRGLAGVKTIWDPQSWPLLVGLVLVAFAPFAVFGLFSFVGAVAADAVGSRVGSGARGISTGAARSAMRIPSRLGASPAGIAASRTGGGTGPKGRPATSSRPGGAQSPAGKTATTSPSTPAAQTSTASPNTRPSTPSTTAKPPTAGGAS